MVATIDVKYEGPSAFLARSLPVEVLDARNVVMHRQVGGGEFDIAAGVYVIRAVDLDGSVVEVEVDLDDGDRFPMDLGYSAGPGPLAPMAPESESRKSLQDLLATSPGDGPLASVELIGTAGCEVEPLDGGWVFQADGIPEVTPHASFRLADRTSTVSLPVNPGQGFPKNACVAVPISRPTGDAVIVRFTMQRAVATAVDGMLTNDGVLHGMEVMETATELLFNKYTDAPAAALGGLTLQRLGHLGDRQAWVENLASGFPWIPDGRILLAAVLAHSDDPEGRQRGLDALLSTEGDRPMFADGHALQVQLLRRWPDDDARTRRAEALERVIHATQSVDWSSAVLTTTGEGDARPQRRARLRPAEGVH